MDPHNQDAWDPGYDMTEITNSIKGLLDSEKYADLTLRCGGIFFKVQCAIVCTRSSFLATAVDGQFRLKEATLRDIELPDDELSVIEALVRYLYTDDYFEDRSSNACCNTNRNNSSVLPASFSAAETSDGVASDTSNAANGVLFNVKMYIAGDKFDITGVKALATQKFRLTAKDHWNSPSFTEAAKLLWGNTVDSDTMLRIEFVKVAHAHLQALMERGEFAEFMRDCGSFSFEIVKKMQETSPNVVESPITEYTFDGWPTSSMKGKKKKGKYT